ncbi:hypothetical protein [Nitrospirillum sp. BR 11163]|uniref:YncE family protein n=1 Tax=Nitrospirillum sp. BR 11163 TaxID=3104323 RepID=UPI002AFF2783|nr:hypothetical protein [Nitrospirillum sp. BR 11163]MEA1672009.1 hypothetical protein [Nitrospirillum sp. BR 11163]
MTPAARIGWPFLVAPLLLTGSAGAGDPPLVLEATIPLPDVDGRIDHMAVDLAHDRLFVAELGNGTVDSIDITSRKRSGRIAGLREPQGIGYLPARDLIVVANAGDGSVRLYTATTLAPVGTIDLGEDADNVRVDATTGQVLVGYGAGGIAVIDPARPAKIADVALPAHPEGFRYDATTGRLYVNVPDRQQIDVLDRKTGQRVAAWSPPEMRSNFPMALDAAAGRIAIGYRSPARLVELNTADGTITGGVPICGDTDDVFFDARRDRYYVSCGEGAVDVVDRTAAGLAHRDQIRTASGARTSLFVPELDRLFVATRAGWFGGDAAILVFRPASR